jgi:virulence-associated protein VapD
MHSTCGRLSPVDHEEFRLRILQGKSDANVDFDDLRRFLAWLGFEERIRGSHHVFRKQGVRELVNLQKEGSKAKVYQVRQVRQVRQILLRYGLEGGGR